MVAEYDTGDALDITTNMEPNNTTFSMGGTSTGLSSTAVTEVANENLVEAMAIAMVEVAKIKEEKKEKED